MSLAKIFCILFQKEEHLLKELSISKTSCSTDYQKTTNSWNSSFYH